MSGRRLSAAWLIAAALWLAPVSLARADAAADWSDYQIIMWQPQSAAGYRALAAQGFTAGMLHADRDDPGRLDAAGLGALEAAGMRWYVENIATDFYSAYHRWQPDGRPVNWRFLAAQARYRADPRDPISRIRVPSLSDPAALARIAARIAATVAAASAHRPLFYNLADEPGIADLNAYWDFDFSKPSLAAMRHWLKTQYPSLAALDAEWGAQFARWDEVVPPTTAAAMARRDGNYAAWGDFHAFMDVAFARAVAAGARAVHAADPGALAGLEGGQKPGWGGYNYATLAGAVDVMETEPELFSLVHDLAPRLRLLSTSFGGGPDEERRIWRALIDGGRGVIVWDAKRQFLAADGSLGPRGQDAASYFPALRDGIGALLIEAVAAPGPVAILYSPASFRVQWLLDWRAKGDAWTGRGADAEDSDDGTVRRAMNGFATTVERLGFAPRYVSPDQLARSGLGAGCRVLILPHAVALSRAELAALGAFAARGGILLADVAPGAYDEHGRPRAPPAVPAALRKRLHLGVAPDQPARLGAILARAGIAPPFLPAAGNEAVARRIFRDGGVTILALHRDRAPGGSVTLRLPRPVFVYDVRTKAALGRRRAVTIDLGAVEPAILALSPAALPPLRLAAPRTARPGETVRLGLGLAGPSPAAVRVFHLEVSDPAGHAVPALAANVVTRRDQVSRTLALPPDAAPGTWRVALTELLSGQTSVAELTVRE